jgi:cholesterol transport system auxiliary component
MIRAVTSTAGLALAALSLAGCALLSTPDPVQNYRFGDVDPPAMTQTAGRPVLVLAPIEFPAAASGDRILTANGGQVAYLAGSRWISPAQTLYSASLQAAFLRDARRVSLSDRREVPGPAQTLDLDVTTFEARYVNGVEYAPTVVIAGRARIVGADRATRAEQTFLVQQPASENRVSAVTAAYDVAVAAFNAQVVAWADANGA